MPVSTRIDQAQRRVRDERERVEAKRDGFEEFVDRVERLPTEPSPAQVGVTAGPQVRTEPSGEDRCRAVRTAFAETVHPHSVDDGSGTVLETLRTELADSIAVALAPTTETSFSGNLKGIIVSRARTRRTEAEALSRALARESSHLGEASETVDEITAWIARADETPLDELGFEGLRSRHETLATHRDRCEKLAGQRQEFLGETTNEAAEIGVRHRSLVAHLYGEFSVDHPLLATVARLEEVCRECQRAVRGHLVRRV